MSANDMVASDITRNKNIEKSLSFTKEPPASIKQLYSTIDQEKKLTYRNLQPSQTRIQGGDFLLALMPSGQDAQSEA